MDLEELKDVIRELLKKEKNKESNLLVFSGDNEYKLQKFLLEAIEISKKEYVSIAIDKDSQAYIKNDDLKKIQKINKLYNEGESIDMNSMFDDVDVIVFGSIDLNTASKIKNLITDTLSSKIASEAIIRGVKVFASQIEHRKINNNNYSIAIKNLEDSICKFGVKFIKVEEIKEMFEFENLEDVKSETSTKIITENFVKNYKGKELILDKDTVITPLAKDIIREKSIIVKLGGK